MKPTYEELEQQVLDLSVQLANAESKCRELAASTVTVTLPTGYTVRSGHPICEAERGVMIPKDGGTWLSRFDVEFALRVACVRFKEK
ncbi:hypothetical protein [Citrobacter freundii]|uniref:hypothetical protein n=1 Tax=Citrobacter freundii TaxID=546 RepID=UPI0019056809|nr:hypothetical protein [Citrobacter freundii]MBJ9855232.1 hypothetical protein [Citrobacter freundii]